jgi:hypothetical protein
MNGRTLAALAGQERTLVIRKPFVEWLGDIPTALLLDQMLFWQDREGERAEWSMTDDAMADHLCISEYALAKARAILVDGGMLLVARKGMPRRMVYVLDLDAVEAGFSAHVNRNRATSDAESGHMCREIAAPSIYEGREGVKDIAPHVTARPSPSAPKPSSKPPTVRAPRPMFDAFMAAFPKAPASLAGRFDAACSQAGLTLDRWHAFMADRKVRESYTDGFLTRNNAGDRFHAWAKTSAARRDPTREAGDNGASLAARNEAFLKAKGWA